MGRAQSQAYAGSRSAPSIDYKAIIERGDVDAIVSAALEVAKDLRDNRDTTTQLRKVFSAVRIIQTRWPDSEAQNRSEEDRKRAQQAYRQAMLMKPRLAYSKAKLGTLEPILQDCLSLITGTDQQRRERFMNLVDFLEAIVAYHK